MSQEDFNKEFDSYCVYANNLTSGLGQAAINVFNADAEQNTILKPFYYTATDFQKYIKGDMTQEEMKDYTKNVIYSFLTVEGGLKTGKGIVNKTNTKINAQVNTVTNTLDEAAEGFKIVDDGIENVVDDISKKADDVVIEGGVETRVFRNALETDVNLINSIKSKYNAGKTRNAASAKGMINGENIDLECISGKFSHEKYTNKGNFEPPQPEDYHYNGPIPEFTNHTEQKIVEYLWTQYKDSPNVCGEIEIISERIFCDNCKVLVDLFEKEFPNIKVTRVEVVK